MGAFKPLGYMRALKEDELGGGGRGIRRLLFALLEEKLGPGAKRNLGARKL